MKHKEKTDIQNIKSVVFTKSYNVAGKEIRFNIQNVFTGIINGQTELLDEILINNMINQIAKVVKINCSKYNLLPDEITISNSYCKENTHNKEITNKQEQKIIESYEPRFTLEQIALNKKVKEQIKTAIAAVKYKNKMTEEWGMSEYFSGNTPIILNFYGKTGTGKSMTAEAIAEALGKKVYHVNYSELESKYVGETPKNIHRAFEQAKNDKAILIFDEADSFLGNRLSSVTQSADYGVNITRSVLLIELEKFSGVVVFTTNLIDNYDKAFKRRILLNVYFDMPDEEARTKIWKLHLGYKMPLHKEITAVNLAKRYDNVSGADIKDMVFYAALHTLEKEKEIMDFSVFDYAYVTIQERYKNKDAENNVNIISAEKITKEEYQIELNEQEI